MPYPRSILAAAHVAGLVCLALACAPVAARSDAGTPPTVLTEHPGQVIGALETAYRTRDLDLFASLLTEDYRFHSYDAQLRRWDEAGFTRDFEITSARCLMRAAEDTSCKQPAPAWIEIRLRGVRLTDDPEHPDSTEHYALAIGQDFQWRMGLPEGDTLELSPSTHVFHLVRGDVARLTPGQPADARHWYVRRWIEQADAPGPGEDTNPAPSGWLSPGQLALRADQNPSGRDLVVWYTLGRDEQATLTVYDVQGRRRIQRSVPGAGGPTTGERRLALGLGGRLEPGIHWVRLEQRGLPAVTKKVTVR